MNPKQSIFLLLIFSFHFSFGQSIDEKIDTSKVSFDPFESEKAKATVYNFVNTMLHEGNVDSMLSICSFPFIMDGELYNDVEKAKADFLVMIKDMGAHSVKVTVDTPSIFGVRKEVLHQLIPLNVYFVINTLKFDIDGQIRAKRSVFAVQVSNRPKITGIALHD